MGRCELRALADRLQGVPTGTTSVRIEWDDVQHLDFRGLAGLAAGMRWVKRQGMAVRCSGLSPYLIAILRFALSLDEIEMFESSDEAQEGSEWIQRDSDNARFGTLFSSFRPNAN